MFNQGQGGPIPGFKNQRTFYQVTFSVRPKKTQKHKLMNASCFRRLDMYIPYPEENNHKPVHCYYSGIKEMILSGTVVLIMGRSSLTIKDISVHLEIIHSDHIGEIIIFTHCPQFGILKKLKA